MNVRRSRNRWNSLSSSRRQNFPSESGPQHHEHLPGVGQHLQDVVDQPRKIVDDRDGGFVLAQWRVAEISLIDGRKQERRFGEELLPMLAREHRRGAADRHDEVRPGAAGERGADVVDHRLFGRADEPRRAHDELHDIHGLPGDLVEVDAEVGGEMIECQVAAGERLQHQDLLDRGLRITRRRAEQQHARQRRTGEPAAHGFAPGDDGLGHDPFFSASRREQ